MSARVAEQLRAGIARCRADKSWPRPRLAYHRADLSLCAAADGVSHHHAAAHFRISQHHQNTSVAITIGLIELTGEARAMQEFSFQVFEAFTAATLLYLLINIVVVTAIALP